MRVELVEDWIKAEDLNLGHAYEVKARNYKYALWDGEAFVGIRQKFDVYFADKEYHYDLDDINGTVKPIRELV